MVDELMRQSQQSIGQDLGAPIILAHQQSFQIGKAEFRPATREVRFAGQTAIIEPRVMQFLIALFRANGAVVSRDEFFQSCWEGRIVGEDAINRAVSRLRSVAENEAGRQFRIETITKVGYRLLSASGESLDAAPSGSSPAEPLASRRISFLPRSSRAVAAAGFLVLLVAAAAWVWLRPAPAAAHSMMVRLVGFKALSADLPGGLRESINAEVTAAFNVDGVISVSVAPRATSGSAPRYSLDGTIYRVGDSIRVATRLMNDRSGAVLWSDTANYPASQIPKVPHKIAVDAGTIVRCGLSGAATYRRPLPDAVLSNYMQYCREYWSYGGSKTLRFAQLVVAEVPDFSWGWSAVGNGFLQASQAERDSHRAAVLRAAGSQAEDKALALDSKNSEALAHKAYLIDPHDWAAQEALFRSAIAAKPLDCGCEHYGYGLKLESVGRLGAAIEQYRAATDMLALWPDSQLAMARALVAANLSEQAKPYLATGIDLSTDPSVGQNIAVENGVESGDYAAAMTALRNPELHISGQSRAALLEGYEALASGVAQAKAQAIAHIVALPKDEQGETVAAMLAVLGAKHDALEVAANKPWLFWRRSMRGVLDDPAFPAVAKQLGLIAYWRTSRTKPDICFSDGAPDFCRML